MSKIISGNYNNNLPEGNILLLFINDKEISCAVADKSTLEFIALDSFPVPEGITPQSILESNLATSDILSPSNYRNVICCSGFRRSTIIPEALYDPENITDQLQFSNSIESGDEILVDVIPQIQAVNIFAIPNSIHQLLTQHYNNLEVHHSSTATITYLLANRQTNNSPVATVIVYESYFEIIVTNGAELVLYNSYDFFSDEEFVYYLLFVCEQLNMNPATTEITFSGIIPFEHSGYKLASNYFPKSKMASRPDNFSYPGEFDILPGTFHFQLFSQLICAS